MATRNIRDSTKKEVLAEERIKQNTNILKITKTKIKENSLKKYAINI